MREHPTDVIAVYKRYLACCNEHRVDKLEEFVAADVSGSGPVDGREAYLQGVKAVLRGFPDYHWDLQEVVLDGDMMCARLIGRGTHHGSFDGIAATGCTIEVQELVMYRFAADKIVRCWGDLFSVIGDVLARSSRP